MPSSAGTDSGLRSGDRCFGPDASAAGVAAGPVREHVPAWGYLLGVTWGEHIRRILHTRPKPDGDASVTKLPCAPSSRNTAPAPRRHHPDRARSLARGPAARPARTTSHSPEKRTMSQDTFERCPETSHCAPARTAPPAGLEPAHEAPKRLWPRQADQRKRMRRSSVWARMGRGRLPGRAADASALCDWP